MPDVDNSRVRINQFTNAFDGVVIWSPTKSLFFTGMTVAGFGGAYFSASLETLLVFLVTTALTLCFGHSLGMHRRLIHRSYECSRTLEHLFVYLGVLVGLGGPVGMMRTHDLRDWAQRQKQCHPYLCHDSSAIRDGLWQLHCDIALNHAPDFKAEESIENSLFYQWLERSWIAQQLPFAIVLFLIGGWHWIIWGVCLRVSVSILGHWAIGYCAHNFGHREWHINGAAAQGYNIRFCGMITMGECWHNNHHAFPGSALLGIQPNQADPGWWVLTQLEKLGLVWNLVRPEDLPARESLVLISSE